MRLKYISLYRVIAMFCIIACHIAQQSGDLKTAYLLNGGVYSFLLISGMLLGSKKVDNTKCFYISRFTRIFVPYYLLILLYLLLYAFRQIPLGWKIIFNIAGLQWFVSGIEKTGHLWYITCISICNILTPICQKIFDKLNLKGTAFWAVAVISGALCFTVSWFLPISVMYIYVFLFGYIYSKYYRNIDDSSTDNAEKAVALLGFISILGRIVAEFFFNISLPLLVGDISEILFGFSLIIIFKRAFFKFHRLEKAVFNKGGVLYYLDSVSYEIYLTHHVFILGVLSCMDITEYKIVNIILAFVLTVASASILHVLSNMIIGKIKKRECNF